MPGLVDMHVHNLVSSSQHLLNLANGVTTVRDMDGFPWMLKMRDQISTNKLLAPNMYVAGHILNQRPWNVCHSCDFADEARRVVRQQKTDGYDFIKIHNNMDLEIYSAILDESKKQKIDAVGHIPHFITIKQAVNTDRKHLNTLRVTSWIESCFNERRLHLGSRTLSHGIVQRFIHIVNIYAVMKREN